MFCRIVAILLLLTTSPVSAELIERGVHHHHHPRLGLDVGDTAATGHHDGHHDGDCDDERDCTPWCHNCRCHARAAALVALAPTFDQTLALDLARPGSTMTISGRDGDRPVLPPPIG